MARILAILLLLMLPAIASAEAADVLVPAGPLSNALALVEANRIPDAMKTLATFRPDMATLGPYHYIYGRAYAAATAADGRYPESSVETHLLVSATSDNDFLDAAWKSYARLPADCVGVTKVDEAAGYGAPYNVSILCGKPIAYLTNGQTVPGDIVSPTREKVLRMILLEGPAGAAAAAAAQRYMRCQGGSMRNRKPIRTIAIASGKGGVGKTNVVANLAIALQKSGKQVLIMDADLGMSNVDILLHLSPRYNIQHVISGEKRLSEVIVEGPSGIMVLPASSGRQELTHLDAFQRMRLLEEFETYEGDIDILLIDTSAGISENVTFFCVASQEIVILTNPEPTGLTGSYALIKVLFTRYQEKHFRILVNSVRNEEDAKEVYRKLSVVTDRFLNVSLDYIGYIPYDKSIPDAVRAQQPFLQMFPGTAASRALNELVARFADPPVENAKGTLQLFIGNLISMGDAR